MVEFADGHRVSVKVKSARNFVCGLLKEKLNILIDFASSQGGTSTTGNVARRCLVKRKSSEKDFIYWVLSTIQTDYKDAIILIHTYLGAILRVYNCGTSYRHGRTSTSVPKTLSTDFEYLSLGKYYPNATQGVGTRTRHTFKLQ